MWSVILKRLLLVVLFLNVSFAFAEDAPSQSFGVINNIDTLKRTLVIGDGEMSLDSNVRIHTNATQFSSIGGLKAGMKVRYSARYSKEKQTYFIEEIWEVDELPAGDANEEGRM